MACSSLKSARRHRSRSRCAPSSSQPPLPSCGGVHQPDTDVVVIGECDGSFNPSLNNFSRLQATVQPASRSQPSSAAFIRFITSANRIRAHFSTRNFALRPHKRCSASTSRGTRRRLMNAPIRALTPTRTSSIASCGRSARVAADKTTKKRRRCPRHVFAICMRPLAPLITLCSAMAQSAARGRATTTRCRVL